MSDESKERQHKNKVRMHSVMLADLLGDVEFAKDKSNAIATMSPEIEICCSAIYFDDKIKHANQPLNIETGFVVTGLRHNNCFGTLSAIGTVKHKDFPYIQGFIDSRNYFVNRNEAGIIAFTAGQTDKLIERLHSEDLW